MFLDKDFYPLIRADAKDNRHLEYDPRHQFEPFHQRNFRWAAMAAHRRAGKTVACVSELVVRATYTKKQNARYAYVAPYYSQAKQIAWSYLKQYGRPFTSSPKDVRESDLQVNLMNGGAQIRLYGADNPEALRGTYFDGIILDEYGDCRPSLWKEVLLPTLSDRQGWATFIGTPKGKNHFYDQHQKSISRDDWYSLTLPASKSHILPLDELEEMRRQMSDDQFRQEFECDFAAATMGTYYAAMIAQMENQGRIQTKIPLHDPDQPVHVSADLGYRDATAFWFWQHRPDGIAFIDYEEHHTQPLKFYLEMLDGKPYDYKYIWLPHDARAKTLQTGRSTVEQVLQHFQDRPTSIRIAPNLRVQQGIDAVRMMLPYAHINQGMCYAGVEALRAYRRAYDENTKAFSNDPKHDWASHGSDAFRYAALVCKDHLPLSAPQLSMRQRIEKQAAPTPIRLDELWEAREEGLGQFQFQRDRI